MRDGKKERECAKDGREEVVFITAGDWRGRQAKAERVRGSETPCPKRPRQTRPGPVESGGAGANGDYTAISASKEVSKVCC
jgi:hypothetical protein